MELHGIPLESSFAGMALAIGLGLFACYELLHEDVPSASSGLIAAAFVVCMLGVFLHAPIAVRLATLALALIFFAFAFWVSLEEQVLETKPLVR